MPVSRQKADNKASTDLGHSRAEFLTVQRFPVANPPDAIDVEGCTIVQTEGQTTFEVGEDLWLTFDAVELQAVFGRLWAQERRRAAA